MLVRLDDAYFMKSFTASFKEALKPELKRLQLFVQSWKKVIRSKSRNRNFYRRQNLFSPSMLFLFWTHLATEREREGLVFVSCRECRRSSNGNIEIRLTRMVGDPQRIVRTLKRECWGSSGENVSGILKLIMLDILKWECWRPSNEKISRNGNHRVGLGRNGIRTAWIKIPGKRPSHAAEHSSTW